MPVAPPPAQLFSDHLFAAPSERISADDVFALSDEMKRYLETEMAGPLLRKGLHKGLIEALYIKNQLLLFKADKRSPGDEPLTKMKAILKAIPDETLGDVAAYYSSLR